VPFVGFLRTQCLLSKQFTLPAEYKIEGQGWT
jgi:hypothetical protein